MGTSNSATLRALAAARQAAASSDLLGQVLAESRRAADNSQVLIDQLTPDKEPE